MYACVEVVGWNIVARFYLATCSKLHVYIDLHVPTCGYIIVSGADFCGYNWYSIFISVKSFYYRRAHHYLRTRTLLVVVPKDLLLDWLLL